MPVTNPTEFLPHGTLVYPGDKIGPFDPEKYELSSGVHFIANITYSSVLGAVSITTPKPQDITQITADFKEANTVTTLTVEDAKTEEIRQQKLVDENAAKLQSQLPKSIITVIPIKLQTDLPRPEDIVICRVVEIMTSQAIVEIQAIEGCSSPCTKCRGVIRARDVRTIDTDGVIIYDAFRPGDLLKAAVISMGDARSYYLSTARPFLGVIYTEYIEGIAMKLLPPNPESKNVLIQYMKCPLTESIQSRKAALPDAQ